MTFKALAAGRRAGPGSMNRGSMNRGKHNPRKDTAFICFQPPGEHRGPPSSPGKQGRNKVIPWPVALYTSHRMWHLSPEQSAPSVRFGLDVSSKKSEASEQP